MTRNWLGMLILFVSPSTLPRRIDVWTLITNKLAIHTFDGYPTMKILRKWNDDDDDWWRYMMLVMLVRMKIMQITQRRIETSSFGSMRTCLQSTNNRFIHLVLSSVVSLFSNFSFHLSFIHTNRKLQPGQCNEVEECLHIWRKYALVEQRPRIVFQILEIFASFLMH